MSASKLERVADRDVGDRNGDCNRQRPGDCPGEELVAADVRRSGPGLAVNVEAGGVRGTAGTAAGRRGGQVGDAGQLWIRGDVSAPARWQRSGAAVVQRSSFRRGVIVVRVCGAIVIADAVVNRAADHAAGGAGGAIARYCAVVERASGSAAARNRNIAGNQAVMNRGTRHASAGGVRRAVARHDAIPQRRVGRAAAPAAVL